MTKYQLDHFKQKVKRHFNPLIEEQELLVKQYRTEATKRIVGKLAKKMGADKILTAFRNAEEELKRVREDAKTFFVKKARTEDKKEKLNYSFTKDNDAQISLSDCEKQLRIFKGQTHGCKRNQYMAAFNSAFNCGVGVRNQKTQKSWRRHGRRD